MVKKTVANDILNLKGKNGLYVFLPFERLDDDNKAVFKCGMTSQEEFSKRIESYHSYFPVGVFLCFFLIPPKNDEDEKKTILNMEKDLFIAIQKEGGKMLKFETRPKGGFKSEWFYTSFEQLDDAFESVHRKYKGSKIERFNNKNINKIGERNLHSKKDKYVGEIVYYV